MYRGSYYDVKTAVKFIIVGFPIQVRQQRQDIDIEMALQRSLLLTEIS